MLIWKKQKQKEEADAKAHKNDSPEANARYKQLNAEYAEIRKAVKGGASSIEEVQLAVKRALQIKVQMPKSYEEIETEIEKASKDPEQVFKEMYKYIKMVGKGLVPSLIICGAPGVGKTWKTTHQLKAMGYEEDVNMYTIKGKCTPRRLYLHLFNYQDKGNIVLIDDADALVGPKAPEDCINILKPGGRLCIITFHSLEDRAVKNAYLEAKGKCTCPSDLPYCICNNNFTNIHFIT